MRLKENRVGEGESLPLWTGVVKVRLLAGRRCCIRRRKGGRYHVTGEFDRVGRD